VITRWINPPDFRSPIPVSKAKKALGQPKRMNVQQRENELWEAADPLRANSKLNFTRTLPP